MKLLNEIIEMLSSEGSSLSGALLKTKVLLHKIGHKELVEWVNYELNGYPDKDSLPPYRLLQAQVLVNASNIAYQVTAHPIPLGHLDPELRDSFETARMGQSLAVLEKFLEKPDMHLMSDIPMEANGLLGQGLASGYRIQRAWSQISAENVAQILVQVRSRLLDFVLELSAQLHDELSEEEIRQRGDTIDAANLFNNAIFGDNATILVGTGNRQTVSNAAAKGDFEALSKMLQQNRVSRGPGGRS